MPTHLPPEPLQTLAELFHWRVHATPAAAAYREFDITANAWKDYSWRDIGAVVGNWARAFGGLHLPAGSRVGILLPNGTTAVGVDLGAMTAGLVPVPMHAIDNPGSIAYILGDSEARVLVLRAREDWHAIANAGTVLPDLALVILTDEPEDAPPEEAENASPQVVRMHSWLRPGEGAAAPVDPQAEQLAAIVYTSGTTGKPKGVMLTHRNVVANVRSVLAQVPAMPDDVFLSFLPLSHTFERTAGYYLPIAAGSCVVYARSVGQIAADLKGVRPTVVISVPRIYERFYGKIQENLAAGGALTRSVFALTVEVGWRRFCRKQRIPDGAGGAAWLDALLWPVLDALAARKIRELFGGRLRIAVSGGAALSPAVAQCFLGMGVPLLQGYGMTETSPVVAANTLDDNWPDSVGHALAGVEVRIGDNRELQVRGDNVMKGYWKRPEDTQKALTDDGWLRSGDQASIEQGRVRILGRIKEIIVTSTGEKIPPGDLELAITGDPLFDQAYVVGENRPFLTAFVVLNREQWKLLAGGQQAADGGSDAVLNTDALRKMLLKHIEAAAAHFPRYAVPRAVWATLEPWTIQNNLMTPTLKLKRNNLLSRYQAEIEAIYRQGRPPAKTAA